MVLLRFGLGIVDHADPFQDSINVSVVDPFTDAPTATQNDGLAHDTDPRKLSEPLGLGVTIEVQDGTLASAGSATAAAATSIGMVQMRVSAKRRRIRRIFRWLTLSVGDALGSIGGELRYSVPFA
jgi:hypothetical protein